MKKKPVELAEEYYTQVGEKNAEGINQYLHPDVEFYSPLTALKGKKAIIEATHGFMKVIETLTIRAKFGTENQAMIVYDSDIPGVAKSFPGASLLNFRDGLIVRIELFFDGSRFGEKRQ